MKPERSGRPFAAFLACAALALCSGCIPLQTFPHCSVLSNQSVDLEKVDLHRLEGQPTSGSSTTFSILGIVPIGKPRIEAAVAQALMKHDEADLLTDVVIRHRESWALLVGWETIIVEGTAVNTKAARDEEEG